MDRYIGIDVRAASCTDAVADNGAFAGRVDRSRLWRVLAQGSRTGRPWLDHA
jgi:hypothetical protein